MHARINSNCLLLLYLLCWCNEAWSWSNRFVQSYNENESIKHKNNSTFPANQYYVIKKNKIVQHHQKVKIAFVVVAYCKGNLSWLERELSELHVTNVYIYSKCGYEVQGFPMSPKVKVQVLPNVGRCDHTYAYFLANDLPRTLTLADGAIFFTKDNEEVHQKGVGHFKLVDLTDALKKSIKLRFQCTASIPNVVPGLTTSQYHLTSLLREFRISTYTAKAYELDRKSNFTSVHKNFGAWFDSLQLTVKLPQPVTPVCYGGSFIARSASLYKISKKEWGRVAAALSRTDNNQEGHFMERTWAGLFSRKKDISNYSTEYCLNPYFYHTSYLGMLCKPEKLGILQEVEKNYRRFETSPCQFCNTSIAESFWEASQTLTLNAFDPSLVLLVGPHKTASSTVQKLLGKFTPHMMKDGGLLCAGFKGKYIGIKNGANLALDLYNNFVHINAGVLQSCLDRKGISSVIVSSEEFASLNVDGKAKDQGVGVKFLLSAKPKLKVIVMLRDFPDWLTSLYMELTGLTHQSFSNWIKSMLQNKDFMEKWIRLNPYHVSRRYENAGIPVVTVNYLDFDFLFCTAIGSKSSCKAIRKMKNVPVINERKKGRLCAEKADILEFERLAIKNYSIPMGFDMSVLIC